MVSGATGLAIQGNFIGEDRTGQYALGNIRAAIDLTDGATNNSIGGTVTGAGNVIANTQASTDSSVTSGGVLVGDSTSNPILSNLISNNAGLGIDLGVDGPTLNTVNGLSNYPIIDTVTSPTNGTTLVQGYLSAAPSTTYQIQVFSDPTSNGDYAQAATYLGMFQVTTNGSGYVAISQLLTASYDGQSAVVSTATPLINSSFGQTSELSPTQFFLAQPTDVSLAIPPLPMILVGQATSFPVVVTNSSTQFDAKNVVVSVTLPSSATGVSGSSTDSSTTVSTGSTLQFTIPSLAANSSETLTVTLTTSALGAFGVTATADTGSFDPNLTNNQATASTTVVESSDMLLTLAGAPTTAAPFQPVVYTINVVNRGPSTAQGVHLDASFSNFEITGLTEDGVPLPASGSSLSLDLGSFLNGGVQTLTVQGTPTGTQSVQVQATISATTADPKTSNNSQSLTTNVAPQADLAIVQSATPNPAIVGQNLVYTVNLRNQGPSTATNVKLTDILPTGATYQNATSGDGQVSVANGVVTFLVGQLAPNQVATLTISVVPTSAGTVTNTASAHSDLLDPVGSNSLDVKLVTAVVPAGSFQFTQGAYNTQDDQPASIPIVIERVDGSAGAASVDYAVTAGTAVAGTDFTPVSGTLHFANGETTQTIQVPVVGNTIVNSSKTVILSLSNPTNGATLGNPTTATLTIVGNTPSTGGGGSNGGGSNGGGITGPVQPKAPIVSFLQRFGTGRQPSVLNLTFNEPMNPALATDPRSYFLFAAGRDHVLGTPDDLRIAFYPPKYDPVSQTVSLHVYRRLAPNQSYLLLVSGSAPYAVKGVNGMALDGNYDGQPGGNYSAIVNQGTYNPPGTIGYPVNNAGQLAPNTPAQPTIGLVVLPDTTQPSALGRLRPWQVFLQNHKHLRPRYHR